MKLNIHRAVAPTISLLVSFVCLAALITLTSPVKEVSYAIVFFGLAFVFLVSLGYFVVRLRKDSVKSLNRYRILVISTFLVITLMFRSAGSLSWLDTSVVLLIVAGLLFYLSKRF